VIFIAKGLVESLSAKVEGLLLRQSALKVYDLPSSLTYVVWRNLP
jgi:hypothetical protein